MNLIAAPPEPGKKTPIFELVLPYFDTFKRWVGEALIGPVLAFAARRSGKTPVRGL
jgi:hypothetical protein